MAPNSYPSKNAILLSEELGKLKNSPNKNEEDSDQNFIKKDVSQDQEVGQKKLENIEEVKSGQETQSVIKKLKNIIFPEKNEQRNLDRETGGLEAEEKKEISIVDVWDGRSEEVDKMGSSDTFNSTGIRSFIWKKKKEKLELAKEGLEASAFNSKKLKGKNSKSAASQTNEAPVSEGYVAKLRHLKQDRDHENNNQNDGTSR
jgi:hypothetical protein